MSEALELAKVKLTDSGATCVILKGDHIYTSAQRGVAPLLNWLDTGMDFTGYCAADKVVGNGAAFLYALLNVQELYAHILSRPAAETLQRYGISYTYGTLVDHIRNRSGTGLCPIEESVAGETIATDALKKIRAKLAQLQANH